MRGFVEHTLPHVQAHLILAGPTVHAVTDDPEEPEALDEVQAAWRALAHQQRARVTVACLPMHDVEENAAIVNALQRHADVIVKKSLEEGFGLGVTEALWKRRAVVASDVGGHRDQIRHQHSGLLVDPADARGFGNAIAELLADPGRASALGDAGHDIVKQLYLRQPAARRMGRAARRPRRDNERKTVGPRAETPNRPRSRALRGPQPRSRETTKAKMRPRDEVPEQASLDAGALDPGRPRRSNWPVEPPALRGRARPARRRSLRDGERLALLSHRRGRIPRCDPAARCARRGGTDPKHLAGTREAPSTERDTGPHGRRRVRRRAPRRDASPRPEPGRRPLHGRARAVTRRRFQSGSRHRQHRWRLPRPGHGDAPRRAGRCRHRPPRGEGRRR